jgi:hypothetical protein
LFLNSWRHSGTELQGHFLAGSRTLEKILANIYLSGTFARDSLQKLDLHSVPELILHAVRKGIIS